MLRVIEELVADRYGSKRGLLRHWQHLPLWHRPEWALRHIHEPVQRLVFICQGNICRSAMAAAVAERLQVSSVSFGLDTRTGKGAEPKMIAAARKRGYDLTNHQAARIEDYVPQVGDLACLMEPAHYPPLKAACPSAPPVTLLGSWHRSPRSYIHDPLCCDEPYFDFCAEFIEEAVKNLALKLNLPTPSSALAS